MSRATTRQVVSRLLFRVARSDATGPVVRFTFAHLSPLLPVRRVIDTRDVIGFAHPKPNWQTHILLVPKVGIPTLLDAYPQRADVITEILRLARELGREMYDGTGPMQLLVNGGRYQDVGQLHFHLICGPDVAPMQRVPPIPSTSEAPVMLERHSRPQRAVHHVLRLQVPEGVSHTDFLPPDAQVRALLHEARQVTSHEGLLQSGFSLIAIADGQELDYSSFHLVSGSRVA